MVGGLLLILYILIALIGPSISPHDLNAPNLDVRMEAPTATHWLGTDRIGRDVLTRIIAGSQVSLQVAAGAVLMALMIGRAARCFGQLRGRDNRCAGAASDGGDHGLSRLSCLRWRW